MKNKMRRLLIATTLGLGLLAGGGVAGSASARSILGYTASRAADRSALIAVHDDYDRPRFARHRAIGTAPSQSGMIFRIMIGTTVTAIAGDST
jgi:hypothetical protein